MAKQCTLGEKSDRSKRGIKGTGAQNGDRTRRKGDHSAKKMKLWELVILQAASGPRPSAV